REDRRAARAAPAGAALRAKSRPAAAHPKGRSKAVAGESLPAESFPDRRPAKALSLLALASWRPTANKRKLHGRSTFVQRLRVGCRLFSAERARSRFAEWVGCRCDSCGSIGRTPSSHKRGPTTFAGRHEEMGPTDFPARAPPKD